MQPATAQRLTLLFTVVAALAVGVSGAALLLSPRTGIPPWLLIAAVIAIPGTLLLAVGVSGLLWWSARGRARAQERVAEIASLQQALDAHVIFVITDLASRVLEVSDRFCEVSGYPREALLGAPISKVGSANNPDALFRGMYSALASRGSWQGLIENQRPDGRRYWLQSMIFSLTDPGGKPSRFVMLSTDSSVDERQRRALAHLATPVPDTTRLRQIAEALHLAFACRWVGIGQISADGCYFTHALLLENGEETSVPRSALEGTPHQTASQSSTATWYADGLATRFPNDPSLGPAGARSYRGFALRDARGTVTGVLYAMDDRPCEDEPRERTLLALAAQHAETVLARTSADRALETTEQALATVRDAADLSIWHLDRNAAELRSDCRWLTDLGYSREDFASEREAWQALIEAADIPSTEAAMSAYLAGKARFFETEQRMRARDGGLRLYLVRGSMAMHEGRPDPGKLVGIVTDITAQRQDELRRAAQDRRNEALLAALPDVVLVRDREGRYTDMVESRTFGSLFARETLVGRMPYDVHPPETAAALSAAHVRVLANRQPEVIEYPVPLAGRTWWREGHIAPLGADHTLTLVRDITARKEAEQALAAERARLAGVLDLAPVGLYVVALDGGGRLWSRACYTLLGIEPPAEPLPPQPDAWFERIHPEDRARARAAWTALVERGEPFDYEYRVLPSADGSERLLVDRARRISTAEGHPLIIGTVEDVTRQRADEAERARLQHQLLHAQKLEALGQLTGGIAHDFNNILASILGYATLTGLRFRNLGDPKLDEYVSAITAASERGRELIQKLLAFSRHAPTESIQTVEAREMFSEVERLLRAVIPASIALEVRVAAGTPALRAEPAELHQSLVNLVVNARDALGERGRITLAASPVTLPDTTCASCHQTFSGAFVEIAVRDDGPGIDADVVRRIFDPFFTTKAFGAGSGLGLAVVHGVLHRHGGHVLVTTAPGHGTAIRLLFQGAPQVGSAPMPSRVLIVDDEPALAKWLQEILEGDGYAVDVYHDSVQAEAALLRDPGRFAAVVTDHAMPHRTGLDLARAVRSGQAGSPVILCSGYTEALDESEARHAGVWTVLRKPVTAAQILATLKQALEAVPITVELAE